jgi:predicted nuclease of restriction endonuclease-like (RecB) superfamily
MQLNKLVSQIQNIDGSLKAEANNSINRLLTMRNWLIGYYIVEYEQKGDDKAKYGDNLLEILSTSLDIKGLSVTNLKLNRLFYNTYPQIGATVSTQLKNTSIGIPQTLYDDLGIIAMRISQTPSDELHFSDIEISQTPSDELQNSNYQYLIDIYTLDNEVVEKLISKLSFSHITLLLPINNSLKRTFYALEAIKGTWSVRELKRQINSLLFERSGLSKKPELLLQNLQKQYETISPKSLVKDLYTFEFLGLPLKDVVEEKVLETALLDNLQHFFMELGHGFCLEARQKRIVIGDEYFFIDLVFYHRLLRCHVLIDLKVEEFNHINAGQLNTYINYYKKEVQQPGENAPIGILLVTNKNDALVEYATAGMDEKLFVRNYMLQLPGKDQLESFIKQELKTL